MTKQEVINIINTMPMETITVDDIIYYLYVRQSVGNGLQEISDGKGITQEQVEKMWAME